jgi:cell fate (sporulation/competence/biofilm development) regulator YmcA (YheA/YmcA/DUF963 family)
VTPAERLDLIMNNTQHIERNMALCDEEIKTRKLIKFLKGADKMSIVDIRVLEAVTRLHEAARVVEQDIGQGPLSQDIRRCADQLSDLLKSDVHCGK